MSRMIHIARFTVLEAWRTRFIASIIVIGIAISLLSVFVGQLAIIESRETQVIVASALLRVFSVLALIVFVVSMLIREQQDKGIEWLLAMPMSRGEYFCGRMLGFTAIAFIMCAIAFVVLSPIAPILWLGHWLITFAFELVIVAGFSTFCAFGLKQTPVAVMAALAFYAMARVIDSILLMVKTPLLPASGWSSELTHIVQAIALVLPDFSNYTQSEWLAYGPSDDLSLIALAFHGLLYLTLLASAALIDLYRKNF